MQKRVVKLRARISDPSVDVHDQFSWYVNIHYLQVQDPALHELFELGEGVGASDKLI